MSLFSGLIRNTEMIGHSFMMWEASESLESEVALTSATDSLVAIDTGKQHFS